MRKTWLNSVLFIAIVFAAPAYAKKPTVAETCAKFAKDDPHFIYFFDYEIEPEQITLRTRLHKDKPVVATIKNTNEIQTTFETLEKYYILKPNDSVHTFLGENDACIYVRGKMEGASMEPSGAMLQQTCQKKCVGNQRCRYIDSFANDELQGKYKMIDEATGFFVSGTSVYNLRLEPLHRGSCQIIWPATSISEICELNHYLDSSSLHRTTAEGLSLEGYKTLLLDGVQIATDREICLVKDNAYRPPEVTPKSSGEESKEDEKEKETKTRSRDFGRPEDRGDDFYDDYDINVAKLFCDDGNLTKNYENKKNRKVNLIVLHETETRSLQLVKRLFCNEVKAADGKVRSSHYVIDLDGTVHQMVPENLVAWHAGESKWKGVEYVNKDSIGIEIISNGYSVRPPDGFTDAQIESVIKLLKGIMRRHNLSPKEVVAHSDISLVIRKLDPGHKFPWDKLAEKNVTIYPTKLLAAPRQYNLNDAAKILAKIGYRTSSKRALDEGKRYSNDQVKQAALVSFCLHYCPGLENIDYTQHFEVNYKKMSSGSLLTQEVSDYIYTVGKDFGVI